MTTSNHSIDDAPLTTFHKKLTRAALGTNALSRCAPVEVETVFEVSD
ncbi:hypothetical protein [Saccharopolyspora shandongensis]